MNRHDGALPDPRAYGVGGDVDMTTIVLMLDAARLRGALSRFGPLVPAPPPEAPPGLHPVCIDLWRIHDGRAEALGVDQHGWSRLAGQASWATAAGPLGAAMGAGWGGLSGAGAGGMMGAWLGPVGFWWGASAGLVAGAATGAFAGGASAAMAGAALGGAVGAGMSEASCRVVGNYREASILVPCVTLPGSREPHLFVERMYTDSALAKWLNEAIGFGFNKEMAVLEDAPGGDARIRSASGATLLSWSEGPAEPLGQDGACIRRWLCQPLLGHLDGGRLIRSRLVRFYDDSLAEAPIAGRLAVGPELSPCIPAGEHPAWRASSARRVPVRLTYPEPLGATRG